MEGELVNYTIKRSLQSCDFEADEYFGPQVSARCRGGFDFTLFFEQSILSVVPSALVIIASILHILSLRKTAPKTVPAASWSANAIVKQVPLWAYTLDQLALVILWCSGSQGPTRVSVVASVLSFLSGLALTTLSYLHHSRSARPSSLLGSYLVLSTILDIAQARTLLLRDNNESVAAAFTAGLGFKSLAIVTEMTEKQRILKSPYSDYPPEALGGIVNRSVFWWVNSLLFKGHSSLLELKDLFKLDKELSFGRLQSKFRHHWPPSTNQKASPHALMFATAACFATQIISLSFFRLCLIGFKFSQPLLIQRAIALLLEPDSQSKTDTGYALIGATALVYIGIAIANGLFRHGIYRLVTMIRGVLVGTLYQATLQMESQNLQASAALTLMSADVDRIVNGLEVVDSAWAGPIEIAIAIYLLYNQIGISFLTPVIIALLSVAGSVAVRKVSTVAQKQWLDATEHRVKITASVLSHIKGLKMTRLLELVAGQLQDLRVHELQMSSKFRKILGFSLLVGMASQVAMPLVTLVTYVLVMRAKGEIELNSILAFTTLALVTLLASPIRDLAKAVPEISAAIGCFQRIQSYLLNNEARKSDPPLKPEPISHVEGDRIELEIVSSSEDNKAKQNTLVSVSNADFAFSGSNAILRDITMSVEAGTWTVILGPVGCGKSALLLSLLNELHILKGSVSFHKPFDTAYCAQDPWLPNMSIRQVITQHVDRVDDACYEQVLDICHLRSDLLNLPESDETRIGSNGVSLSGGQKQRVSLARALYSRKSLLLLDDVLGGLDLKTEQSLVDKVFGRDGYLRAHSITAVLATQSIQHAKRADHVIVMAKGGTIFAQGNPGQIPELDGVSDSIHSSSPGSKEEFSTISLSSKDGRATREEMEPSTPQSRKMPELDISRQTSDIRLYVYYFQSIGWPGSLAIILFIAVFAVFLKLPTLWVRWWSDAELKDPGVNTNMYIGIYGLFGAVCLFSFTAAVAILFLLGIPASSNRLHQRLLDTVINAPYWYFVATDAGQIINYFSQDMALVCLQLPFALVDTFFNAGICLVGSVLILLASKWAAAIYPGLIIILYLLQRFYLRTSRQIRLLDLEAKSPLYTQFMETMQGLTTIRAFGWQMHATMENGILLDQSQRPFYLMYCIQRWLNIVLDLLVAGLAIVIVCLATQLKDSSAGALGVSMLNILTFGQDLVWLIRAWTELETALGAVSRIRQFERDTACENLVGETEEVDLTWPSAGKIEWNNVQSSYRTEDGPVLKDISLLFEPGSKIGICGRTGSGKSTCILTLLRMTEIVQGDILVDGISIKTIPRQIVRSRINTIPQEHLFIPGTIRLNMDPYAKCSEDQILSALGEAGILDTILELGGLDAHMEATMLSRGQKQLFCLARAILRPSQIVLLDEMTSSVDLATEAKMMELVEKNFKNQTVIAIAHHLSTIRNFDKIIVLDQGCIAEHGSPDELLSRNSIFRHLWESSDSGA